MRRLIGLGDAERFLAEIFGVHYPKPFPTAVIVFDLCRDAINRLVHEEMDGYAGAIAETETEAIDYIYKQWQEATS